MIERMPRGLMAVVFSGSIIALIGALGVWSGQPWLIPSLGPSLYLHTMTPKSHSAKALNTFVGHTLGLAVALVMVYITGADAAPSVTGADVLTWPRVAAAALAVSGLLTVQLVLRLGHPPAAATTLMVALGAIDPTLKGAITVLVAVALLTVLGEAARRLEVRKV